MIHNLLDRAFLNHILLALRRLTDNFPLKKSDKDVYSIVSIIKDIKKHTYLLKRYNLFKAENIEYDIDLIKSQLSDFESANLSNGNFSYFIPGKLDVSSTLERHAILDILSGVANTGRSESDCIKQVVFDDLLKGINAKMNKIETYVNKKIAHASTPENGDSIDNDISIKLIVDSLHRLSNISNFVQCCILNLGISQFQFIQADETLKFKYIDLPLISNNAIELLDDKWTKCESEYLSNMFNFDKKYSSFNALINELIN